MEISAKFKYKDTAVSNPPGSSGLIEPGEEEYRQEIYEITFEKRWLESFEDFMDLMVDPMDRIIEVVKPLSEIDFDEIEYETFRFEKDKLVLDITVTESKPFRRTRGVSDRL